MQRVKLVMACAAVLVMLATRIAGAKPFPPDPSFGDRGSVVLDEAGNARNVALQSSGRILVLAQQDEALVVLGLLPDGSADTSFATHGVAGLPGSGPSRAYGGHAGLVVQADDRIVVSGRSAAGGAYVARLLSDGALDASFGVDGMQTPALGPALCAGDGCDAVSVAIDAAGRIIAAVSVVADDGRRRIAVLRLTVRGAPDPDFGDDGLALLAQPPPDRDEVPVGALVAADGRIVVAANRFRKIYFDTEITVYTLRPDGTPDPAFAGGNAASVTVGDFVNAATLVLLPRGRILVGGSGRRPDLLQDMMAVRLLPSGVLDRSFGDGGIAFAGAVRNLYPYARSTISGASTAIVAPDGKILLAGVSGTPQGSGPCPQTPHVALAALTSAGRATSAVTLAAWEGVPRGLAFTRSRGLVVAGDEPPPCMSSAAQEMRVTQLLPIAAPSTSGPAPIRPPGGRTLPRR